MTVALGVIAALVVVLVVWAICWRILYVPPRPFHPLVDQGRGRKERG
jgi:hypothetical protein